MREQGTSGETIAVRRLASQHSYGGVRRGHKANYSRLLPPDPPLLLASFFQGVRSTFLVMPIPAIAVPLPTTVKALVLRDGKPLPSMEELFVE